MRLPRLPWAAGRLPAGLTRSPAEQRGRSGATLPSVTPTRGEAERLAARFPGLLVAADRVASSVAQGVHGRRRAGAGDSFWQYRQALPGEPASRIDWRQSARSSRAYVRETEWEAAQTVLLWRDQSGSMRWRSHPTLPTKLERAELLLLALGALLLRGGEHIRLLGDDGRPGQTHSGRAALDRLALALAHPATPTESAAGVADNLLPQADLPAHGRLVLLGDFLQPMDEIRALLGRLAAARVVCHLVQVLDPAELDLMWRGRVRFLGLEAEDPVLVPRAEAVRPAYAEVLAGQLEGLAALCTQAGFGLTRHHTDQRPELALLGLYAALSPSRTGGRA